MTLLSQLWTRAEALTSSALPYLESMLWQSSVLFLGACALLRRRAPALRHALCLGALLLAPVLPLLSQASQSVGLPQAALVLKAQAPATPELLPALADPSDAAPPRTAASDAKSSATPRGFAQTSENDAAATTAASTVANESHDSSTWRSWLTALVLAYFLLVMFAIARFALGLVELRRTLSSCSPEDDPRVQRALEAARGATRVTRPVRVVHGARIEAAFTTGSWRPVIALPTGFADRCHARELRAVLTHECCHIRRFDSATLALASLVRSVLFVQPLAWIAMRRVVRFAEDAVDAVATRSMESPAEYAALLERLATHRRAHVRASALASIGTHKSVLLHRVEALFATRRPCTWRWASGVSFGALACVSIAIAMPIARDAEPRAPQDDASRAMLRATVLRRSEEMLSRLAALRMLSRVSTRVQIQKLGARVRESGVRDVDAPLLAALDYFASQGALSAAKSIDRSVSLGLRGGKRISGVWKQIGFMGFDVDVAGEAGRPDAAIQESESIRLTPARETKAIASMRAILVDGTRLFAAQAELDARRLRFTALGRRFDVPRTQLLRLTEAAEKVETFGERADAPRQAWPEVRLQSGEVLIAFPLVASRGKTALLSPTLGVVTLAHDSIVEIVFRRADPGPKKPAGRFLVADYGDTSVTEYDAGGREIFKLEDLFDPLDAEWLPNGNFLITEQSDDAVREYDRQRNVVWQFRDLKRPFDADRLANGNTLITDPGNTRVIEVNAAKKIVWSYGLKQAGQRSFKPYAADRLANGNTLICDHGGQRVIEVDPKGKTIWSHGNLFFLANAHRLANGNTLITLRSPASVVEIDPTGKAVWKLEGLRLAGNAVRLPDGTTLVSEDGGANIYARSGKKIGSLKAKWVTSAIAR